MVPKAEMSDAGRADKDWELPIEKWHEAIEKTGKNGKAPRKGTVTAKDHRRASVTFDDGSNERVTITSVVEIKDASKPPQYQ